MTVPGPTNEASDLLAELTSVSAARMTAHELVRTTLRQGILTGVLPGGTRLVQADIAAQLGVSTTPVREALRDLATEGLINLDSHRGAVVRSIDLGDARKIYELRLLLEPLAMSKAAGSITADELDGVEELHERMQRAPDDIEWVELDRRFHRRLVSASRGIRLPGLVANLQDSAAMYVGAVIATAPQVRAKGDAEHREMLDALRERDGERAAAAMRSHLMSTVGVLLPENTGA